MKKIPVTITIDLIQDRKLRDLQSELILKTDRTWSYSKILGMVLDEGIKSFSLEKAKKKL